MSELVDELLKQLECGNEMQPFRREGYAVALRAELEASERDRIEIAGLKERARNQAETIRNQREAVVTVEECADEDHDWEDPKCYVCTICGAKDHK